MLKPPSQGMSKPGPDSEKWNAATPWIPVLT